MSVHDELPQVAAMRRVSAHLLVQMSM